MKEGKMSWVDDEKVKQKQKREQEEERERRKKQYILRLNQSGLIEIIEKVVRGINSKLGTNMKVVPDGEIQVKRKGPFFKKKNLFTYLSVHIGRVVESSLDSDIGWRDYGISIYPSELGVCVRWLHGNPEISGPFPPYNIDMKIEDVTEEMIFEWIGQVYQGSGREKK
jgi:hypothetical protein